MEDVLENRDQTNLKMFDVTARLLTGTTGITTLTQAFSLDERKATKRMMSPCHQS